MATPIRSPKSAVNIAGSVHLAPLSYLGRTFAISRRAALRMLNTLRVPVVWVGDDGWFMVSTLAEAFYHILGLGGASYAAPGVLLRNKALATGCITALPDEALTPAARDRARVALSGASAAHRATAKSTIRALLKKTATDLRNERIPKQPDPA